MTPTRAQHRYDTGDRSWKPLARGKLSLRWQCAENTDTAACLSVILALQVAQNKAELLLFCDPGLRKHAHTSLSCWQCGPRCGTSQSRVNKRDIVRGPKGAHAGTKISLCNINGLCQRLSVPFLSFSSCIRGRGLEHETDPTERQYPCNTGAPCALLPQKRKRQALPRRHASCARRQASGSCPAQRRSTWCPSEKMGHIIGESLILFTC